MSSAQWTHRLPASRTVHRIDFLRQVAAGKRVIHLGFWGTEDCRDQLGPEGLWLHDQLGQTAASLVGIDYNEDAVARARGEGYEAYAVDCRDGKALTALELETADVVIAGELIEHLDSPGAFLDAIHALVSPGGTLVVTTPNAYALLNPITALRRFEIINPDHVVLYSWFTLRNMMERHGWAVREILAYDYVPRGRPRSINAALGRFLVKSQSALARIRPFVGAGLIAVAHPMPDRAAESHR